MTSAGQSPMDTVEAAEYLGRSPRTLAQWRHYRSGPVFAKDDRGRVTYMPADLDAWRREKFVLDTITRTPVDPEMSDDEVLNRWAAGLD